MEAVALAFRFGLGGVFVLSGAAKLSNLSAFESAVGGYRILPARLVPPVSRVLPPLELAAGALMGLGVAVAAVGALMAALMVIFAAAAVINLLRGRSIDCGCSGLLGSDRISWALVARNLVLAAAAVMVVTIAPGALALPVLGSGTRATLEASDALAVLLTTLAVLVATPLFREGLRIRMRLSSGGPRHE